MTNTTTTATVTEEKLYKRYDLQDTSDFAIETLQEMRDWLADFWNCNPDEDMTDEEHEEMIEAIDKADENELFDRLGGVDYSFCEVDEDPDKLYEDCDLSSMEQNFSWGFGVHLLKLDEKTLQVTVKKAEGREKNVWTTDLPDREGWDKIFKEQTDIIREELKHYTTDTPRIQYLG